MTDARVVAFLRGPLRAAFAEVARSCRADASIEILDGAIDDPIHATLVGRIREAPGALGPTLIVEERARRTLPFGGRFLVTPSYRVSGLAIYAAPIVMYQVDRVLQVFPQRYTNAADVRIEDVTRDMILAHVRTSFSRYRAR